MSHKERPAYLKAVAAEGKPLRMAAQEATNALFGILNIEGAAMLGAEVPALEGLDVPAHFANVRKAIKALTDLGFDFE